MYKCVCIDIYQGRQKEESCQYLHHLGDMVTRMMKFALGSRLERLIHPMHGLMIAKKNAFSKLNFRLAIEDPCEL